MYHSLHSAVLSSLLANVSNPKLELKESTFTVPEGAGTYWLVFEMDGASGAITPINTIVDDVNAEPIALPE